MALHPFIAGMLEKMQAAGQPGLSAGTPAESRQLVAAGRAAIGPGPEMASVRDVRIATRDGDIPGRLLVPNANPAGLVIYLHGGGWVLASIDDFDTLGRELAMQSGCAVLLVEYRLAPEHRYPAPLNDVIDAIVWADASAPALLGRKVPLVVAGDSAGGNMATVAARALRGRVELALQVLAYPVTDCDFDSPTYRSCSDGMPLTRADMEWFFDHYVDAGLREHEAISPLRATEHQGVPPAFIATAEVDVLRHEGESYAQALQAAGVPVTQRRYAGVTHGFLRLHNHMDVAREAVTDVAKAISSAVAASRPAA